MTVGGRDRYGKEYGLEPVEVSAVKTKYRRISTWTLHLLKSIKLVKALEEREPRSMFGQVPVDIRKTYGVNVEDLDGNVFLDRTSDALVTNICHTAKVVADAVKNQLKKFHFVHSFPYQKRLDLVEKLIAITLKNINHAFLLSTGSEAVTLLDVYEAYRNG